MSVCQLIRSVLFAEEGQQLNDNEVYTVLWNWEWEYYNGLACAGFELFVSDAKLFVYLEVDVDDIAELEEMFKMEPKQAMLMKFTPHVIEGIICFDWIEFY